MRYGSPGELLERREGRWGTPDLSTVREAVRTASGHGVSRPAGAWSGTLSPQACAPRVAAAQGHRLRRRDQHGQDGSWTGSTDGAGRWEQGHRRARQLRLKKRWARGPLGKPPQLPLEQAHLCLSEREPADQLRHGRQRLTQVTR